MTLSCPKNTPYYSANCVRQTTASAEIDLLNVRRSFIIISVLQCLWFSEAELEDSVKSETQAQSPFVRLKHKHCCVPERCKEYLRGLSIFIQLILFDRSTQMCVYIPAPISPSWRLLARISLKTTHVNKSDQYGFFGNYINYNIMVKTPLTGFLKS